MVPRMRTMRYPGRSFMVLVMTPWVSVKTAGRALSLSAAAAAAAGVDEDGLVCYVVREVFGDEGSFRIVV